MIQSGRWLRADTAKLHKITGATICKVAHLSTNNMAPSVILHLLPELFHSCDLNIAEIKDYGIV